MIVVLDCRTLYNEGLHEEFGLLGEFAGELHSEWLVVAELVIEVAGVEENDVHARVGALGQDVKVRKVSVSSDHGRSVHLETIETGGQ
ncbi:hypothetical protein SCAR479_08254 [Seiridium cardinale]|uniref:Uncharacterized protein n=1 Tax=Seiridium cardinale TaxID=138064 RepID=A0ABR2XMU2_9PEZI